MRAVVVCVGVGYMEKYANPVYTYGQSSVLSSMSHTLQLWLFIWLRVVAQKKQTDEKKEEESRKKTENMPIDCDQTR